jgi:hypothetical protein
MYSVILVEAEPVEVTDDVSLPSLFQVNQQIRQEAWRMWHKRDEFHITMCD